MGFVVTEHQQMSRDFCRSPGISANNKNIFSKAAGKLARHESCRIDERVHKNIENSGASRVTLRHTTSSIQKEVHIDYFRVRIFIGDSSAISITARLYGTRWRRIFPRLLKTPFRTPCACPARPSAVSRFVACPSIYTITISAFFSSRKPYCCPSGTYSDLSSSLSPSDTKRRKKVETAIGQYMEGAAGLLKSSFGIGQYHTERSIVRSKRRRSTATHSAYKASDVI